MALIRLIFWIALFLVSTFVFTVLFEHGITDFSSNARKEYDSLKHEYFDKSGDQKKPGPATPGLR